MWLDIISIGLSALLSGLSIFIAIRAYKQGTKQIEISNKQSLFKERTNAFLQLNSLYEIYRQNNHLLDGSGSVPEVPFHMFTNNKFLEGAISVAYKPLSSKEQNIFLIKMEELREIALQVSLLWDVEQAKIASGFVYGYVELLCALYRQCICVDKLRKQKNINLTEAKQSIDESAQEGGLNDAIKLIAELYNRMKENNVLNTLKEQIKLK